MRLYIRRAIAYIIDFLVLSILLGIYMFSAYLFWQKPETSNKAIFMVLCGFISVFFLCGYMPAKLDGQTIGKLVTRIQVVSKNGKKRSIWQIFCREFILKYSFVIVFIPSLISSCAISIFKRKKFKVDFIHDEFLDTQVINKVRYLSVEDDNLVL